MNTIMVYYLYSHAKWPHDVMSSSSTDDRMSLCVHLIQTWFKYNCEKGERVLEYFSVCLWAQMIIIADFGIVSFLEGEIN
ncbi:hypothetical protein KDA_50340 [Dictyobacter alpinus]|uniref:Uncharacterized protein n=1 Tax=Dictyobacter alpinus TaxID=2014873 RepID=A0A402BE24_9CHLR|nr:hypothetical protein KDA_50340 [Dictyobacter alpinus]